MITRLAETAARRVSVTVAVWLALLGLGLYSYFGGLAREGFPPVDVPIVVVDGTYFVDDPAAVDRDVTTPLYEAYLGVDGVEQIQTIALPSSFAVIIEFATGVTSPEGADRLRAVTPDLGVPADPTVRSIEATKFIDTYDVLVSLNSPAGADPAALQAEAARLAEQLQAADAIEVAEVRDLLTEGLDPATGSDVLRQTRYSRVAFGGDADFREAIAIGLIRNDDRGLDVLEFSDEVKSLLADASLTEGFDAAVTADFANDIRSQLSNLMTNLLTGLVAVAIVSFLLIGWRVSIITAAFMGTVMLTALLGLWLFGYSLNTITLFGLILTLGLLVDDAIVVSESIDASRSDPDPDALDDGDATELAVIRTAINRVGSASLSGTLTTVLVFAPMLFVSGVLGEFIRAIPATVIITLLLSFLFSMTVIPALGRRFLLSSDKGRSPLIAAQRTVAKGLGSLAAYPSRNGLKGIFAGVGLVAGAFAVVGASFGVAATVGFNIFPEAKDTNALLVTADFDPGVTIDEAAELTADLDDAIVEVLGDDLVRAQYIRGNERSASIFIDLVSFADRSTTSPTYADRLLAEIGDPDSTRVSASAIGVGPPSEEFPFAVQIQVDESTLAAGERLAVDIRDGILGQQIPKSSGDDTIVTDTLVSTEGQVFRTDGVRQIEVRAAFDTTDTTNNLDATEQLVRDLFPDADVEERGLAADAVTFDFGFESDNQDDFASLGVALMFALVLMLVLLMVQFRSVVQPLLIFLAIPFSFFGVFGLLSLTDNSLSFFVMVGFIALIGVVVNNTILLVDAANQARRGGANSKDAIRSAVEARFRPLLATTLTTVAGLLPLALSDPFWEPLSFTLIGGLLSSTVMVLLVFPVFYLAAEAVRTPIRNAVRRRRGRDLIV